MKVIVLVTVSMIHTHLVNLVFLPEDIYSNDEMSPSKVPVLVAMPISIQRGR